MKVLLRFNKEDNKFVDMQNVTQEYIYKYQDVEELEEKDGYYTSLEYDEKTKKAIMKYVEIQKTKEQLLEEEIEKIKRAIADGNPDLSELDTLRANSNRKKTDSIPNLSELDNL
ncbi:hypothetical protein HMPREF9628_01287 [Peptoanaerobacter stomatis]|uniref:Uncharacterized protein n=1 Tax=Peptoanaerobacter stomatis TaxID=796937 RepID=G9XBC0_9FIRM|nr:hypothetical protein [Peptoanaerobacter stomatis]EHL19771.1 hypothetical protein HMPREF9628_01287 [Peptoanaerobacter stomatis]